MSQALVDHMTAKSEVIAESAANSKVAAQRLLEGINHLRKQRCDWCGGYGHRNNACGFRKRLLIRSGTTILTKALCESFHQSGIESRRHLHDPDLALNLPPAQIGRKRTRASSMGAGYMN